MPVYAESLFGRYHFGWSELTALTDERYRYIKAPREELYDLQHDPGEHENLADERADLVAPRSGKKLKGFGSSAPPAMTAATLDENRGRYDALGYVGIPAEPPAPWSEYPDPKDRWDVMDHYRSGVEPTPTTVRLGGAIERFRATETSWSPAWGRLDASRPDRVAARPVGCGSGRVQTCDPACSGS